VTESLVRKPRFVLYLAGTVTSTFGDMVQRTALTLLVIRTTGSALDVSGLLFAYTFPAVLFGPVAGTLVDWFSPRRTVIVAELVQGALVLGLLFAPSLAWIIAIVFCCALARRVTSPGRRALLPRLAGPEQLVSANAWHATGTRAARTIGPAVGAALIVWFPPEVVFLLNAATFAVSALCLGSIGRLEERAPRGRPAGRPGFGRRLSEGLRHIATEPRLIFVTSLMTGAWLLSGAIHVLLVLLVTDVAKIGDSLYGVVASAIAAGYIFSGPFVPRLARRFGCYYGLLALALLVDGLLTAALPLLSLSGRAAVWLLPTGAFLIGAESCVAFVTVATIIQEVTPEDKMGRVFGLYDAVVHTANSLSLILVGLAVELVGLCPVLYGCGAGLLVCGLTAGLVPRLPGSRLPYEASGIAAAQAGRHGDATTG